MQLFLLLNMYRGLVIFVVEYPPFCTRLGGTDGAGWINPLLSVIQPAPPNVAQFDPSRPQAGGYGPVRMEEAAARRAGG